MSPLQRRPTGRLYSRPDGIIPLRAALVAILRPMSPVEAIEREIEQLSPEELVRLREWFANFDAAVWDRQLEADVRAGKLDSLAERALRAHASGQSTKL